MSGILFCLGKLTTRGQGTINDEGKVIANKYMSNNTKTVIKGFQCVTAEQKGLLGCGAVWLGNFLQTFWEKTPP
jgi:hypothetical protein